MTIQNSSDFCCCFKCFIVWGSKWCWWPCALCVILVFGNTFNYKLWWNITINLPLRLLLLLLLTHSKKTIKTFGKKICEPENDIHTHLTICLITTSQQCNNRMQIFLLLMIARTLMFYPVQMTQCVCVFLWE